MENLNKENYFTEIWAAKYPKAKNHFCKWIDKYKLDNKWNNMFATHLDSDSKARVCPIKFHTLPFAMQFGILCEYTNEFYPHWEYLYPGDSAPRMKVYMDELNDLFKTVNNRL